MTTPERRAPKSTFPVTARLTVRFGRSGARLVVAFLAATMIGLFFVVSDLGRAHAQEVEPLTPAPQVERFLKLLADPSVQNWLQQTVAPGEAPAASQSAQSAERMNSFGAVFARRVELIRSHIGNLLDAIPRVLTCPHGSYHSLV